MQINTNKLEKQETRLVSALELQVHAEMNKVVETKSDKPAVFLYFLFCKLMICMPAAYDWFDFFFKYNCLY